MGPSSCQCGLETSARLTQKGRFQPASAVLSGSDVHFSIREQKTRPKAFWPGRSLDRDPRAGDRDEHGRCPLARKVAASGSSWTQDTSHEGRVSA